MSHHSCAYPQSGWDVVEVISGFCEVGADCEKSCPYSWRGKDKKMNDRANRVYEEYAKEAIDRILGDRYNV